MAPLRYAANLDPFLSLACAPTPSTLARSKERKGSNFAIWQPCSGDMTTGLSPYYGLFSKAFQHAAEEFCRVGEVELAHLTKQALTAAKIPEFLWSEEDIRELIQ